MLSEYRRTSDWKCQKFYISWKRVYMGQWRFQRHTKRNSECASYQLTARADFRSGRHGRPNGLWPAWCPAGCAGVCRVICGHGPHCSRSSPPPKYTSNGMLMWCWTDVTSNASNPSGCLLASFLTVAVPSVLPRVLDISWWQWRINHGAHGAPAPGSLRYP